MHTYYDRKPLTYFLVQTVAKFRIYDTKAEREIGNQTFELFHKSYYSMTESHVAYFILQHNTNLLIGSNKTLQHLFVTWNEIRNKII